MKIILALRGRKDHAGVNTRCLDSVKGPPVHVSGIKDKLDRETFSDKTHI